MKNLLIKELRLTLHPTAIIFIALSLMLIIPNYPYYVIFFYTGLGVFFTCLNGRENNDVFFTMLLPVNKKDIVTARFLLIVILEILQAITAVPFAILRQGFTLPGNQVGMDANIAFFGLSFAMLGIFNFIFFTGYYKDVTKVGKPFVKGSAAVFVYMSIMETLVHIVPFMRDKLDTPDTQFVKEKLIILAAGLIVFSVLTLCAYKKSVKSFLKQDI